LHINTLHTFVVISIAPRCGCCTRIVHQYVSGIAERGCCRWVRHYLIIFIAFANCCGNLTGAIHRTGVLRPIKTTSISWHPKTISPIVEATQECVRFNKIENRAVRQCERCCRACGIGQRLCHYRFYCRQISITRTPCRLPIRPHTTPRSFPPIARSRIGQRISLPGSSRTHVPLPAACSSITPRIEAAHGRTFICNRLRVSNTICCRRCPSCSVATPRSRSRITRSRIGQRISLPGSSRTHTDLATAAGAPRKKFVRGGTLLCGRHGRNNGYRWPLRTGASSGSPCRSHTIPSGRAKITAGCVR
jgi:hypothetical protein